MNKMLILLVIILICSIVHSSAQYPIFVLHGNGSLTSSLLPVGIVIPPRNWTNSTSPDGTQVVTAHATQLMLCYSGICQVMPSCFTICKVSCMLHCKSLKVVDVLTQYRNLFFIHRELEDLAKRLNGNTFGRKKRSTNQYSCCPTNHAYRTDYWWLRNVHGDWRFVFRFGQFLQYVPDAMCELRGSCPIGKNCVQSASLISLLVLTYNEGLRFNQFDVQTYCSCL